MEQITTFLSQNSGILNLIWWITIGASLIILLISIYFPYGKAAKVLPLSIMFNPKENADLDFQSVGYAMMHSTWLARISHYTIFIDAFFWFIVFSCIHWSVALAVFLLMVYQSRRIAEKSFAILFLVIGAIYFLGALFVSTNFSGNVLTYGFTNPIWLYSISFLMATGWIRFFGHLTEPAPPMMLDDTDQFVKMSPKSLLKNWKILIVTPFYGYVAEFSSGLPSRLFTVQVNYLNQIFLKSKPEQIKSWEYVKDQAEAVLKGGYQEDEQLNTYFQKMKQPGKVR